MDPLFCVSTAGPSSHMPCAGSEHGFDGRRRLYGRMSPVHCILGAVQSYHGGTRRARHALCCGRLTLIDIYPYKQVRCVWSSPARSILAPLGLLAARSGLLGRRARFGHFPSHTRAQVRVHVSLLSSCCAVQALRAQALRSGETPARPRHARNTSCAHTCLLLAHTQLLALAYVCRQWRRSSVLGTPRSLGRAA